MCGRFTLTVQRLASVAEQLQAIFDAEFEQQYQPRYNIAPGAPHWMMRQEEDQRRLLPAAWGLINHFAADARAAFRQINARSETVAKRPAYREAFKKRRCVVPADGFYEWTGPRRAREPLWFHPPAGGLLLFAGLYEGWINPETGELLRTFTVITTAANDVVRPIHDRMPAILEPGQVQPWLLGDDPHAQLRPAANDKLALRAASPRVNSAANDDVALLDPNDPKVVKQLRLF